MKLLPLIALTFIMSACGPRDVKLEHPLLRKSQDTLESEFTALFAKSETELPLQLPLMISDQNLEAAKILEFALSMDSEIERLNVEIQREARGERANRGILCRDIQEVASNESQKRYVVTYGCKGRTGTIANEIRGQELYVLNLIEGKVRSISMETYNGFESRIQKYDNEKSNRPLPATQATLIESRRLEAKMSEENSFTYSYSTFIEFDQKLRRNPKDYKDGYEEKGTISSIVQANISFETTRGKNVRFMARTLSPLENSRGRLGELTIKGDRQSIDRSKIKFNKFYVVSSTLSKNSDLISLNYNNCGEIVSDFKTESRWISGKKGNYKGNLTLSDKEIVYREMPSRTAKQENELAPTKKPIPEAELRWSGCYGRSPILPLVPRNKFFVQ